jgi:fumarylacetoacetate (FAA) hydrolase
VKLATLRDGTPDGRLVVVSRDLASAAPVPHARSLQAALDNWDESLAEMLALSERLDQGRVSGTLAFDPKECLSPLPRAYQWADGSAYLNHVELVRKARGVPMPESFASDPLMYQGGSDAFLAPHEAIPLADEAWGCDLEAEIAVVTRQVPMGTPASEASAAIRLVMLVNDVSLRGLIPGELAKGFGFFQSKPSSAFSPCAVTPDELGPAWDGRRLAGRMQVFVNGQPLGDLETARDLQFDFAHLIEHAARTRPLGIGTIIGSGTVSNRGTDGGPGLPITEGGRGYACIAEQRAVETILHGGPRTAWLKYGDRVRIEMRGDDGGLIFGAIEQVVAKPGT